MNSLAGRATSAEARAAALEMDLATALANTRPSDVEVALRTRAGTAEARAAALQVRPSAPSHPKDGRRFRDFAE